ncbi:small RNA degrading nuclease 1 [Cannabis sativa]|uniref:small RNA degrading nuclease 1 n=1 Tax=Cannabis sativa TaxID=3483 RepID=UPI0029CA95D2|nr:small RNA degrading nuclease 1 [Cannabis sativa]XP_060961305.1 small RNA degrading nuclease 1 [Cannabis sativa]
MEDLLATAEKKALVEIVKMVQKRGFKGSKGEWKEFLSGYDKKFGARLSDPAKRSNEVLVSFLKTFDEEEHLKYVTQLIQSYSKRNLVQKLTRAPENESPEQMLVRLTLEHPQYPLEYSFPSKEQGWIVTKLGKMSNVMSTDNILAVDCEMVLCVDGTEAAVRVCVVDRNLEVKLNVLVNPKKEVADYRTEITGITAADLEGVTCTLANVQKSLMKILYSGNILAGHSLSNDLNVLKIDHAWVIDTSYIFRYSEGPISRRPSLNNLCKSLLGYEVRKAGSPHNCLDDACAAMKLVLARLEQKAGDTIPYKEMNVVPEIETPKLLLHRIPSHVPTEELLTAIPGDFTIETKSNRRIKGDKYTTYAIFKSLQEAEEAYEKVEGSILKDTLGRPQKLVTCKLSTGETYSLCVRSTGRGDCLDENLSKKRAIEVQETSEVTKKLKTDEKIEEETPTENKKTKKERKSKKASKHKKNKKGKKKRA